MKCIPCRVTFEGVRYQIQMNGDVFRVNTAGEAQQYGVPSLEPTAPYEAAAVRREAGRQRRNRNARDRHQAMTDLGMKRVRGGLGGVYYE